MPRSANRIDVVVLGARSRLARALHARKEPVACEIAARVRLEIASTRVYAQSMHFALPSRRNDNSLFARPDTRVYMDRLVGSKSHIEG